MILKCLRFLLNNVHFLWEAISPAIRLKWADLLRGRQGGEYILPPLGFCTAFLYLSNELDWQQNNIWILDLWPTEFSILSAASGVLRGFPLFLKSRKRLVHDSALTELHQGFKAGLQKMAQPSASFDVHIKWQQKPSFKWKYCAFMFDLSGWFPWKKKGS